MKRSIGLGQLMGFAVTSLCGTILHFLYEWLDNTVWVAPFSGVNESTWEHMKLLFWPMFLFALIESVFFKDITVFWCIKLKGILFGLFLIPILFYTYNGVIAKPPDWINVAIFFLTAFIVYVYETKHFVLKKTNYFSQKFSITLLCLVALLFVCFTFKTPEIGIFRDPVTGIYGI